MRENGVRGVTKSMWEIAKIVRSIKCFHCGKIEQFVRKCSATKPFYFDGGESGHFYENCTKTKTEVQRNVGRNDRGGPKDVKKNKELCMVTRARDFQMTIEEATYKPNVVVGTFTLNSLLVCVVFDSGGTFLFVSS